MIATTYLKHFLPTSGVLRRYFFASVFFLSCLFTLAFLNIPLAQALTLNNNPGDQYVFGADSPVFEDGNTQYALPAISGNICFWSEYSGIMFKDLSKGSNEPGRLLLSNDPGAGSPAISHDTVSGTTAHRIVWSEWTGLRKQTYFKDIDINNLQTFPGTADQAASRLPVGTDWQSYPSISQDGSKIAWQEGTGYYPQIYFYDFATGQAGAVNSNPNHTQSWPSADNDWVTWTEDWNYSDTSLPRDSAIYAKRIGSSDPPVTVAYNGGNNVYLTVVGAKIGRNLANEPIVVYVSTQNNSYFNASQIHMFNLVSGTDTTLPTNIAGEYRMPSFDGDKVVWQVQSATGSVVELYDLSSNVTQTVSQKPDISADMWPQVSSSSKYIVWKTNVTNPGEIYYNQVGSTAKQFADKYMPELVLQGGPQPNMQYDNTPIPENFQPMPVEQFLTTPGTYLKKRWYSIPPFEPKPGPLSAHDLASVYQLYDMYIDLPGDSKAAGGGELSATNPSLSLDNEVLTRDYVAPYQQRMNSFPKTIYSRVVSRPSGSSSSFIQYWILYYANDFPEVFHEGDWELVQIDLAGDLKPARADYSQHGNGHYRNWNGPGGVEKTQSDPDKPVVYVARGSHANYFKPASKIDVFSGSTGLGFWDSAQGGGVILNNPDDHDPNNKTSATVIPEVEHSSGTPFEWLTFGGQWGEYTNANIGYYPELQLGGYRDGPKNPPVQNYWNNAFAWNDSCDTCQDNASTQTDLEVTKHSPVDIRLYDSRGRVMAKNLGPSDIPIPNAEYLEYPELDRASIVVRGGNIRDGYRVEADGNGLGSASLTVTAPDHSGSSVDTLNYNAIVVNNQSKITMNLDSSKNYVAAVDTYGDGTKIIQKSPDTQATINADFIPPAQVLNLSGSNTAYGSATLTFTTPGDDGNQGTAAAYDLRYSTSAIADQYWNDAIPVGSLPAPLPAGNTQSITANNLTPGTTYYFALKTMDKVGLISPISNIVSLYILVDTAAPVITNASPNGWVTSGSPILTASYSDPDPSSGVKTTSAALSSNGGAPIPCTAIAGSISCSTSRLADGYYAYTISIADNANNVGTASGSFDVDTVAPALSSPSPSGLINTSSANLTASYADSGSGINTAGVQVSLDGTVVSGCTAMATSVGCPVSGLAEGAHSTFVRVTDVAGNVSTSSGSFGIDTIAPAISNVFPNGWVTSTSPTIIANYSDSGSGINTATATAKVNGSVLSGCTITSTSISCPSPGFAQGIHALSVSVSDNAANAGNATGSFQVDSVPPVTTDNALAGWQNANFNVSLTCTDATSGCASTSYELDGGATQTGNSVNITTEGTHTITYRSKDVANNTEVTRTATARLDKTPPTTTDNAPTGWQNANFNVTLTCSDVTSGCTSTTYEVDGGATQTGNSVSIATEGTHTITYRSKDAANNTESTHTKTVNLDKIAPSVSNVMPAGWINTASPTISASYSDSVSGINSATAVARIDGNIVAGCTVTAATISCPTSSLSQGSHTFTVSVSDNANNGGIGSSTFQVDTIAPSITNVQPSDLGTGTPGTQPSTTISASYSDAGSGTNTSTASAKLDGASLSGCTITSSSISCAVSGLAPGNHTIAITAADNVGNIANGSGSFNVVRNYYWSWYDQHSSGYQDWVFFASPTWSSNSDWFNLKIDAAAYSPGQVLIGQVLNTSYPTVIGGPVQAISTTGAKSIVSQRVLLPSNSLEEVPGQDSASLSDHYYWTWYDNTGGTTDWILVANQNASAVYYEIRIAGQLKTSGNLAAGANVTPTFPTSGGPVEVQAWADSSKQTAAKVIASQRVLTNSGTAFNELPGTPAGSLSSTYYWTWYDNSSSGVTDWVMVSNQNTTQIYYEISVAGLLKASGNLASGANTYPTFPGVRSGPVKVQAWTSSNKQTTTQVVSSQRILYGPSFEEVPGYPQESLASDYHWVWYDYYSTNTPDYVMVANQNTTQVYYEVTVAGQLKASGTLAAGANATPAFSGLRSGPVEVQAWTDTSKQTTAKVLASQRVVWNGYFNEVWGQVLR